MPKDSSFNVLGTSIELAELSAGAIQTSDTIHALSDGTVGAGTWAPLGVAAHGDYGIQNSSATDADNVTWTRWLAKGTYAVTTSAFKRSSGGIMKIDFGGTTVHTHDTYDAGTVSGDSVTTEDITVATSGDVTIKVKVDGKNGSSSGYSLRFGTIVIRWTGE